MSKKDNNINNVDEADVNINDTDVTSDTDKDADTSVLRRGIRFREPHV